MNKSEKEYIQKCLDLGCTIANEDCGGRREFHHVTSGNRRIDHFHGFCLCTNHHGPQTPLPLGEAIHYGKKSFEKKYGKQVDLLSQVWEKVGQVIEKFEV